MHWISVLLIAFASNLDNLAIGISLGVRSTKIPAYSNGIIAGITMAGTYLSMNAGAFISEFISEKTANLLGAAVIVIIGAWSAATSLRSKTTRRTTSDDRDLVHVIRNPDDADVDHNQVISLKESAVLGMALALNNMATGLGAGATGVSAMWTTIAAGVFSLFFIKFGSEFGLTVARSWFGRYSEMVAGILLLLIGLYEMFA